MNPHDDTSFQAANPFIALDEAQRKRKRLLRRILVPLIIALLVAAPFVFRASRLWGLPDIGEPFDVAEFVSYSPAQDENAFTYYRQATGGLTPVPKVATDTGETDEQSVTYITELVAPLLVSSDRELPHRKEWEKWIAENEEVLLIWKQGTEYNESQNIRLEDVQIDTSLETSQQLRDYTRLAIVKAKIHCDDGRLDEAWNWYRAMFRCSRHLGHRSVMIDRLIGVAIYSMACNGVLHHWANHPGLTEPQLATAIQDLTEISAMTPPYSDFLKAEYFVYYNTLSQPEWPQLFADSRTPSPSKIGLWLKNEPEFTLRILKIHLSEQLYTLAKSNDADGAILPVRHSEEFGITAEKRERLANSSTAATLLGLNRSNEHMRDADTQDKARQAALITLLAGLRYQKQTGEYPTSIGELQKTYPELSFADPCSTAKESLLHYRRDEYKIVVWSVGMDGQNNNGSIAIDRGQSADVGFEFKFPNPSESSENAGKSATEAETDSPSPKQAD